MTDECRSSRIYDGGQLETAFQRRQFEFRLLWLRRVVPRCMLVLDGHGRTDSQQVVYNSQHMRGQEFAPIST